MRLSAIAATALLSISIATTTLATTRTWSQTAGGSTGSWTNGGLWSPAGAPQPADDIMVTLSGSYSCTTGSNFNISSLTIGGSNGSKVVEVSSSTGLAMTGAGTTLNSNATLRVRGAVTDGKIDVNNGGTLRTQDGSMITGTDPISLKGGIFVNEGSEFRSRGLTVTETAQR